MESQAPSTLRRSGVVATMIVLAVALSVVASDAGPRPGCETDVAAITEKDTFTARGEMRTHLPDYPIAAFGQAVSETEARLDDLPLRWQAGDGDSSIYQYFLDRPLDDQITVPEFRSEGGIEVDRDVVTDDDPYGADDVIAQVGDRAVKVQIGEYDGALVWADPESNGARPHHLYWSDGTYNYALIAVRAPERMVQLGRELVCGT